MSVTSEELTDSDSCGQWPLAVLRPMPQSCDFSERRLRLEEEQRIGRSVAKSRPGPDNAVFDCRVLSRDHGRLRYDGGRFLLVDCGSANGSFVNGDRLGRANETSQPAAVFSGDVVQLGVDVVDNVKQVRHSCVVAELRLFHPDGGEATRPGAAPSAAFVGQLQLCLAESQQRERRLAERLDELRQRLAELDAQLAGGWAAALNEERLLAKLDHLADQVAAYSASGGHERCRRLADRLLAAREAAESRLLDRAAGRRPPTPPTPPIVAGVADHWPESAGVADGKSGSVADGKSGSVANDKSGSVANGKSGDVADAPDAAVKPDDADDAAGRTVNDAAVQCDADGLAPYATRATDASSSEGWQGRSRLLLLSSGLGAFALCALAWQRLR